MAKSESDTDDNIGMQHRKKTRFPAHPGFGDTEIPVFAP